MIVVRALPNVELLSPAEQGTVSSERPVSAVGVVPQNSYCFRPGPVDRLLANSIGVQASSTVV